MSCMFKSLVGYTEKYITNIWRNLEHAKIYAICATGMIIKVDNRREKWLYNFELQEFRLTIEA